MKSRPLAAFLSCEGYHLSEAEKKLFATYNPAGVTLFARNIQDKNQLKKLTEEIKDAVNDDVLIAVDQEGGRVRRLKGAEYINYASQEQIGTLENKQAVRAAKLHAKLISTDLHNAGIAVNFAPVLDIEHKNTTKALDTRCFSDDVLKVAELGQIMVETYIKSGIIPCIKHLPGHGLAEVDPHLGLPVINADLNELMEEFYPFKQCAFAPLGMTAHIVLTAIDDTNPITLSAKGIKEIIRGEIGFEGFLISDAIDMHALCGSVLDKASRALQAGCDCVCYCFGQIDEMEELCRNCPKLADNSMERLDKAKLILHNEHRLTGLKDEIAYNRIAGKMTDYATEYDATEVLHNMKRKKQCLLG